MVRKEGLVPYNAGDTAWVLASAALVLNLSQHEESAYDIETALGGLHAALGGHRRSDEAR